MFKKRTIINKNQSIKQSLNLNQEIDNLEINNHQTIIINNQSSLNQQKQPKKHQYTNKMTQSRQNDDQDNQFTQRLQKDKKFQDLFDKFQNHSKKQSNQQISQVNKTNINAPILFQQKSNNLNIYSKKKINLYSTLFTNQTNITPILTNQIQLPKISTQKSKTSTQKIKASKENQMQNIFNQILQQNKKQEQEAKRYQQNKVHQYSQFQQNKQHSTKANQFIIQDDDGYVQQIQQNNFTYTQTVNNQPQMMKVAVDYDGNISPQISDAENNDSQGGNFHQQDFQDQLIRKTLTRNNYLKVQQKSNLKQTKMTQKKQKLLNTILKTSWHDIESKLTSDINIKITKKNDLNQQMKYLQDRISEKSSQVDRKKVALKQLEKQHLKLKRTIYFLCYFGDQLCGPNQSLQAFFNDLTPNLIDKIQKLSDKVGIEEFMQHKRSRDQMRDKYHSGRKKIKVNQNFQGEQQIIVEQEVEQDDDQDGQFYMDQDDL